MMTHENDHTGFHLHSFIIGFYSIIPQNPMNIQFHLHSFIIGFYSKTFAISKHMGFTYTPL